MLSITVLAGQLQSGIVELNLFPEQVVPVQLSGFISHVIQATEHYIHSYKISSAYHPKGHVDTH